MVNLAHRTGYSSQKISWRMHTYLDEYERFQQVRCIVQHINFPCTTSPRINIHCSNHSNVPYLWPRFRELSLQISLVIEPLMAWGLVCFVLHLSCLLLYKEQHGLWFCLLESPVFCLLYSVHFNIWSRNIWMRWEIFYFKLVWKMLYACNKGCGIAANEFDLYLKCILCRLASTYFCNCINLNKRWNFQNYLSPIKVNQT